MENKKTTELLDLLTKLTGKDGKLLEGWEEAWQELKEREPFFQLLNEDYEDSLVCFMKETREEIDELKVEIKKLKRHKHDEKTGDVLIRI